MDYCEHIAAILPVKPSANGCEDCLKIGDSWGCICVYARIAATSAAVTVSLTAMQPSITIRPLTRSSDRTSPAKIGDIITSTICFLRHCLVRTGSGSD